MQLVKTAETFWLKHETLGGICQRVRGDKLHCLERYLMGALKGIIHRVSSFVQYFRGEFTNCSTRK